MYLITSSNIIPTPALAFISDRVNFAHFELLECFDFDWCALLKLLALVMLIRLILTKIAAAWLK